VALPHLPRLPKLLKRRPRPGSGDFSWDLEDYVAGNALALFVRGQSLFAAMFEAIERAEKTVHLETYRFGDDFVGRDFAALLARKARGGMHVRVICDSLGSIDLDPAVVTLMRNSGVQVLEYHPVAPWRPRWAWNRRDHRKILVCDGRTAFIGGMNISAEHAPESLGGLDWPDAHARVEGPAAYELDRLFREVWFKQTSRSFDLAGDPARRSGSVPVKAMGNQEFLKRMVMREAYVNALRAARHEVCIANSYFVPGGRIRRSLAVTARRGVNVRVLVPGFTDAPSVWHAMRARYDFLLANGVRIFEWQGAMMHAKAVVVDDQWSALGSFNLDHRSLQHNLEAIIQVLDGDFARNLRERFEQGLSGAREITLDAWRRRPYSDRLQERFWSSFDYFF
jgi:cardiolipin synthase